jgi:hypothetical protein
MGSEQNYTSYTEFYRAARQRSVDMVQTERNRVTSGKTPWRAYGTPISELEKQFAEDFTTFLNKRRKEKGKVFVLDVMGTGGFIEGGYPVDGEVALTLVDFRDEKTKRKDQEIGKMVVEGDVLQGKTWREISDVLRSWDDTKSPGFDLITSRPFAGWDTIRQGSRFDPVTGLVHPYVNTTELFIIKKSIEQLSNGGTFVVDMGNDVDKRAWATDLQKTPEIDIDLNWEVARIRKLGMNYGQRIQIPHAHLTN